MSDEQKVTEDKTKALRAELSETIKDIITSEKFQELSVHFFIIDDDTGAFGYGGTMCPVCAMTAMMQAVMRFNIKHTDPTHQMIQEEMAKHVLGSIFGMPFDEDETKH